MRKHHASIWLTVFALTVVLCGCAAQKENLPTFIITECNQEHLHDGVLTGTDNYIYTYNEDGLAIYEEYYQDGDLFSTASWEYDEFGNTVTITREENGTVQITEYKNTLDKDGRILRQEMYLNGVLSSVDEYTYDRRGNELTHTYNWISENEEMADWRKYTKTYNFKGDLTRETLHWNFNDEYIIWDYEDELCVRQTSYETETDKITEYWTYSYDEKGSLLRKSRYDEADNLSYYNEYTWDNAGLVQTEMSYNADGTPRNHFDVYTYDEYGNEIMQERYQDGAVYWRISYVYEAWKPEK